MNATGCTEGLPTRCRTKNGEHQEKVEREREKKKREERLEGMQSSFHINTTITCKRIREHVLELT